MAEIAALTHGLIDADPLADGVAMAVAAESTGVTVFALAGGGLGRTEAEAVAGSVAGGAAIIGMGLAAANEGRAGGGMAALAVVGDGAGCDIGPDA